MSNPIESAPAPDESARHHAAAEAAVRYWMGAGYDVAEMVAHVLCTVAADEPDGLAAITRNRPDSWEAGHIIRLIRSTAGWHGEYLDQYRKETPD